MMTPEERKRRLEIFRGGIKTEFWKLVKEELSIIAESEGKTAIRYLVEGKHEKALSCDGARLGLERAMSCPETIVKYNDSIFNKIAFSVCDSCGQVIKKVKEVFNER